MPASLGLKLYNLGHRRDQVTDGGERPARPPGRLVWLPGRQARFWPSPAA